MANKVSFKLKGFVGGWDFDPGYVDWLLDKHKSEEVEFVIDSLGGSAFNALSIAASFKAHGNVNVHYVGFNASAATIVSMGAKHVSIDAHAMYLVHKCSAFVCEVVQANADDLQGIIAKLDAQRKDMEKIDLNIASMYAARCKKSKENLMSLMKAGGWLTAQEAKDWGFVDEITDDPGEKAQEISNVVAEIMLSEGMPLPPGYNAKKPNLLRRMVDAWVSMFEYPPKNFIDKMSKVMPLICSALKLDSLNFVEGVCPLTEEQAQCIEDALSAKDAEISTLKAAVAEKDQEIENLKNAPAEDTLAVVDDGALASEADDFFAVAQNARDLYNSIL